MGKTNQNIDPSKSHVTVEAKPDESIESLLRRFKQKVKDIGLMDEIAELQYYEKPSKKRREEEKLRLQRLAQYRRSQR